MIFHFHWWQMGSPAKSIPLWKTALWRTVTEDVLQVPHASCPSVLLILHQLMDHVQPVPVGLLQHLHDTSGCLAGSSGLGQLGQSGNITDTVSGAFRLSFPCVSEGPIWFWLLLFGTGDLILVSCPTKPGDGCTRCRKSPGVCLCCLLLLSKAEAPPLITTTLNTPSLGAGKHLLQNKAFPLDWKSVASYGWLATKKFCTSYQHPTHVAFVSSSWTFLPLSFMLREKVWLVFQSLQTLPYQYEWVFKSHLWLKLPACIKQNWEEKNKKLMYFQCQSLQTQWSIQLFQATHDYGLLSCCPAT